MSSESLPTFKEIFENVVTKVYLYAPKTTPEAQELFAQDIMDALAEAYSIGTLHATETIAANLNQTPITPKPNPYERTHA